MIEKQKTAAFDLDGVFANYDGNYVPGVIGEPIPETVAQADALRRRGYKVGLYTARSKDDLPAIRKWLEKHKIKLDFVQTDKLIFDVLIDDRALRYAGPTSDVVSDVILFKEWWRNDSNSNNRF